MHESYLPEPYNAMRLTTIRKEDPWDLDTDEPDVRGWPVRDREGNHLGRVEDLLLELDTDRIYGIVTTSGRQFRPEKYRAEDGVVHVKDVTDADRR